MSEFMLRGTRVIKGVLDDTPGSFASFTVPNLKMCPVSVPDGTSFHFSRSFDIVVVNGKSLLLCPPMFKPSDRLVWTFSNSSPTKCEKFWTGINLYIATSSGWYANLDVYTVLSMYRRNIVVEGIHFAAAVNTDGEEVFVALGDAEFTYMEKCSTLSGTLLFRAPGSHYKGHLTLSPWTFNAISPSSRVKFGQSNTSPSRHELQGTSFISCLHTRNTNNGNGWRRNLGIFACFASTSPNATQRLSREVFEMVHKILYTRIGAFEENPLFDNLNRFQGQLRRVVSIAMTRALMKEPVSINDVLRLAALCTLRDGVVSGTFTAHLGGAPMSSKTNVVGAAEIFADNADRLASNLASNLDEHNGALTLRDVFSAAAQMPVNLGTFSGAEMSSLASYSLFLSSMKDAMECDTTNVITDRAEKMVYEAKNPPPELHDDLTFLEGAFLETSRKALDSASDSAQCEPSTQCPEMAEIMETLAAPVATVDSQNKLSFPEANSNANACSQESVLVVASDDVSEPVPETTNNAVAATSDPECAGTAKEAGARDRWRIRIAAAIASVVTAVKAAGAATEDTDGAACIEAAKNIAINVSVRLHEVCNLIVAAARTAVNAAEDAKQEVQVVDGFFHLDASTVQAFIREMDETAKGNSPTTAAKAHAIQLATKSAVDFQIATEAAEKATDAVTETRKAYKDVADANYCIYEVCDALRKGNVEAAAQELQKYEGLLKATPEKTANAAMKASEAIKEAHTAQKSAIAVTDAYYDLDIHLTAVFDSLDADHGHGFVSNRFRWVMIVQGIPLSYKQALAKLDPSVFSDLFPNPDMIPEGLEGLASAIASASTSCDKLNSIYIRIAAWMAESTIEAAYRPEPSQIYNALKLCPFNKVKAIIIGQDPQSMKVEKGYADGVAFSSGLNAPSDSLKRIFEFMQICDENFIPPNNGDLTHWTKQGVLLLNTFLTCGNTGTSHKEAGWNLIVSLIVKAVLLMYPDTPILALGAHARECAEKARSNTYHSRCYSACHPSNYNFRVNYQEGMTSDKVKDNEKGLKKALEKFLDATHGEITWFFNASSHSSH